MFIMEASSIDPNVQALNDPSTRAEHQRRLRELQEELVEEGADAAQELDALRARAAHWPE